MTVYTLFSQQVTGQALTADNGSYTFGMQFSLSASAALTGIWFYSPPGAGSLPDACCIYQVAGASQVAGTVNTSPSWSGAAGTGWVKCSYNGAVTLAAGTPYRVCIHHTFGSDFYGGTAHYWDTGPGSAGLVSGIISAPASSGADGSNQDAFDSGGGSLAYPASSFNSANYWVDVEVTTSGGVSHTATASLTVTPSFTAARTRGRFRAAALTVSPSLSAARTHGHGRTASLLVTPSFTIARQLARVRHASLLVVPSFTAVPAGGAAPAVQQGSWWGLDSVLKQSRQEFDAYASRPPVACPVCGEPLMNGPATNAGSGVQLYCKFAGDHEFHYPRDWNPPSRPMPW